MEKKDSNVTTDLAQFGMREIEIAKKLLTAWVENGLPNDFFDSEVTVKFNRNSGFVFLTNSEYQVACESGGILYSYYNCFNCGVEGFEEDGFPEEARKEGLCNDCYKKEENER